MKMAGRYRKVNGLIMAVLLATMPFGVSFAASGGETGFDVLTLEVGGRPLAMGGAFTGLADDMNAMFYNPAGLGNLDRTNATLFHRTWVAQTGYSYLGVAGPVNGLGAIGGSIMRVGGSAIDTYDENGNLSGSITPAQMVVSFSLGVEVNSWGMIGASIKYAEEDFGLGRSSAVAGDLAVLINVIGPVKLGLMASNLGRADNGVTLPVVLRGGISGSDPSGKLNGIVEVAYAAKDDPEVKIGLEYRLIRALAVRAGYAFEMGGRELDGQSGITAGVGFGFDSLSIDYAFTPLGILGNAHFFGITYRGGGSIDQSRRSVGNLHGAVSEKYAADVDNRVKKMPSVYTSPQRIEVTPRSDEKPARSAGKATRSKEKVARPEEPATPLPTTKKLTMPDMIIPDVDTGDGGGESLAPVREDDE